MPKYRPFSTGSQAADWNDRNCNSCKKGFVRVRNEFRCDWERELVMALFGDGQILEEVASGIGYLNNKDCYIWEYLGWIKG